MTLYALQDIDDAIAATRSFLWPFDFGRWLKLAFVVFFLGGTGSANPAQFGNTTSSTTPSDPGQLPSLSEIVNSLTPTEWAIIGAIVGAIILIGVGFAFVGAVMEFVFVESIRRERVSIRSYWGSAGGRAAGCSASGWWSACSRWWSLAGRSPPRPGRS
ncbi:hypothetical protein SY89_00844 [Halolamina pelagica]|uniref:Uncharacterized protein n=2 Tax=Halolamina pelagica TaxID=699431 RepID=A0A0P7GX73_9EURY|nr:hypothetical protein SY89_00844 [Halolamina pelagica]